MIQQKKIVVIIAFFAIVVRGISQDYIRIENIGPNIKYFDILLVGNGKIPDTGSLPTTIVSLDSSTFEKYESAIIRHLPNVQYVKRPVFGTFEVAIRWSGKIANYCLLNSNTSILFFKKVVKSLKGTNIDEHIEYTLEGYIKLLGG